MTTSFKPPATMSGPGYFRLRMVDLPGGRRCRWQASCPLPARDADDTTAQGMAGRAVDRVDSLLGQEIDRAGLQRIQRRTRTIPGQRRQHQDIRRFGPHDLAHGRNAIHLRHCDIHGDQVGLQNPRHRDSFASVTGLTGHQNLAVPFELFSDPFTEECRVVDDQYADPILHLLSTTASTQCRPPPNRRQ